MIDRERLGIEVLKETAEDLVVLKPAGMASELTRDPRNESLIARVRLACPPGVAPRLVHRLDRVTRGLMVVALTKDAAAFHGEQIREGVWDKYYLARLPTPDPGSRVMKVLVGKHKAYIAEESDRARLVRAGGKPSLMEVLACAAAPKRKGQCHVLIRLLTGRLHQIRVMMAGLGLPLIGDTLYGGVPGQFYLDHCALWHALAGGGSGGGEGISGPRIELSYKPVDPEREPLGAAVQDALDAVTSSKPSAAISSEYK